MACTPGPTTCEHTRSTEVGGDIDGRVRPTRDMSDDGTLRWALEVPLYGDSGLEQNFFFEGSLIVK